jgi:hypothetical protein
MDTQAAFDKAMYDVYINAKEHCNYNATYFLQMLEQRGSLATARYLLATNTPSEGFTRLWECGRLDLTVEAVILQPAYESLFTDEERQLAAQRLQDYGYTA